MKRMRIDLRDALDEDAFYKKNHRNKQEDFYKKSDKSIVNKKHKNKSRNKFNRDDDDFENYQ
jgi:hypothetical protein